MSPLMLVFALSQSALGFGAVAQQPEPQCEVSKAWAELDESVLDLQAPAGTTAVPVYVGCSFKALPGAVVSVELESGSVDARVLGLRRAKGSLLVALEPEQVASVPSRGVTPVQVTEHSDRWLDLINAMHEVRHH